MKTAVGSSRIRLWIAGISSAMLLAYAFLIPSLYRPGFDGGLHSLFLGAITSIGLVSVIPIFWKGSASDRVLAVLYSSVLFFGFLNALLWYGERLL